MVSKDLLSHKDDKVFIIGKGLFDAKAAGEYGDAVLFLRKLGFSSIVNANMFHGTIDPSDQTAFMRWCGMEVLKADILYIICSDKEIRKGPFELFSAMEWCRELAHSVKMPVFFKEYECVDE